MKQKRIISIALGLVLLVGVVIYSLRPRVESVEMTQKVEEILRTPQTYDGEQIDNLVRLGSDAVPAIGEVLTADAAEFPLVLVIALRDIGDSRGAEPILSFIENRAPHSDADASTLTAAAIRALGSIPSPTLCEPLSDILEDVTSHPRLRLTAAATVIRSCEAEFVAAAENLIVELYRDRREYFRDAYAGFDQGDLYDALLASMRSDEVADILINFMKGSSDHIIVPGIIESMDGGKSGFSEGLLSVLNAPGTPFETRLLAAKRLLALEERPDESLRLRIEQLVAEAETNNYPPEIIEGARELERNAEAQLSN